MKIEHILFPIDFSECSRALDKEVEWLAKQFNSDVTLMHVFEIPPSWYGTGAESMISAECFEQCASNAQKRLMEYPLAFPADRVNRVIAEGEVAWHIKNWVEEHPVDLIMMGTHGYGSMRRALLGSVAMKLLHDVGCPIWTHSLAEIDSSQTTAGISKIICALELTQEAVPLLRFTRELAQQFNASVRLVHTVPETEARPYRYFDSDLHKQLKAFAAKDIERFQHEAGTDFPVSITDGCVSEDTAALASEEQADLIVVGRGKAQELFGTLRTHTYDIIRLAPRPVISYCSEQVGRNPSQTRERETPVSVN